MTAGAAYSIGHLINDFITVADKFGIKDVDKLKQLIAKINNISPTDQSRVLQRLSNIMQGAQCSFTQLADNYEQLITTTSPVASRLLSGIIETIPAQPPATQIQDDNNQGNIQRTSPRRGFK